MVWYVTVMLKPVYLKTVWYVTYIEAGVLEDGCVVSPARLGQVDGPGRDGNVKLHWCLVSDLLSGKCLEMNSPPILREPVPEIP